MVDKEKDRFCVADDRMRVDMIDPEDIVRVGQALSLVPLIDQKLETKFRQILKAVMPATIAAQAS